MGSSEGASIRAAWMNAWGKHLKVAQVAGKPQGRACTRQGVHLLALLFQNCIIRVDVYSNVDYSNRHVMSSLNRTRAKRRLGRPQTLSTFDFQYMRPTLK